MAASGRNRLADWLVYVALRMVAMLLRALPNQTVYAIAGSLGNLAFNLGGRHGRRAVEHLRRSFPHWSQVKLRRTARASLRNLVYLAVETLLTTYTLRTSNWRRYIHFVHVDEGLSTLLRDPRGAILLTGHLGNFEVVGYVLGMIGFPTVALAKRLSNPYLDRYLMGLRETTGQRILDKQGAAAEAPAVLDAGGVVSIIADQDAGRKGVFVDFFGRPASTYKSFGLLAMQHDVPIIVGFGRRVGEQYRFELLIERVIQPEEWAQQDNPLHWISREYHKALEAAVSRYPEQYFWHYRRWKTRPKGELPPEDGIA